MQEQEALFKIIYQIVTLCLLGLTGFIAGRTGYLPENSGAVVSRVVVKLTAPILIITTMADYNFTSKTLMDGASLFVLALIFLLFAFVISIPTVKLMKLEESKSGVYQMMSMFGNVIYLAYPLLSSLYGQKGIIYAVFFNLANDLLLWTLGIYLVNRHNTSNWKDNAKHLVNGNTIAFSLGIIFILTNFKGRIESSGPLVKGTYELLFNTFNPLGKTTVYLSMIFIGLILSQVRFEKATDLIKRYPLIVMSFFKLIAVPVIALLVLNLMTGRVDAFVKEIVVLQLAMPCGTIVAAIAAQHEADYGFATEGIFVSTLLGAVTMPIVLFLLYL